MASRKDLLSVSYHDDDDTGMYHVGEVDFGIHGELDSYLKSFGREGHDDLVKTLSYLLYEVQRRFRESVVQEMPTMSESQLNPPLQA